jgi:hypothetical protein
LSRCDFSFALADVNADDAMAEERSSPPSVEEGGEYARQDTHSTDLVSTDTSNVARTEMGRRRPPPTHPSLRRDEER